MAGKTAILAVKIISDATGAAKGFDQASKSSSKFEKRMGVASNVAKLTGASLIGIAVAANKQASDLQQANGAVVAVFGSQSEAVKALAKQSAASLGIAASEYSQTAAIVGSQLKNMGVAQDQLVPKTQGLIKLGGDLAATYGGTTADAVEALSSLLRGETDPIEKYGVSIKQADIAAQLAAKGQGKLTGAAKKTAQTEALLAILTKQTGAAQGQRAREAGSYAQEQEVALAKVKDAGAKLGVAVLPVFTALASALGAAATFATEHQTTFLILAGVLGTVAVSVVAVNTAYKTYTAISALMTLATKRQTTATKASNLAFRANPIGLVVTAVLLLVAGLIYAYKHSERFRAIVDKAGHAGVVAFKTVWGWIKKAIDLVKELIDWVKQIDWGSPPKWLSNPFGKGGAPGGYGLGGGYATSSLRGRGGPGDGSFVTRMAGGGGATVVNIRIDGALDPSGVAKQIVQLLSRYGIKLGGTQ